MKNSKYKLLFGFFFYFLVFCNKNYSQSDAAPIVTASANQIFCPGSSINIAPNFSISDSDDSGIGIFFIQISSGYQNGRDILELQGNHPNIQTEWNNQEGKLTLRPRTGNEMTFDDLEDAVKNVFFHHLL